MFSLPVNSFSMRWSLVLHGLLLLGMFAHTLCMKLWPKKLEPPLEFTVVLPPAEILQKTPSQEKQEEDEPEPEQETVPLPPPVPVKDAVTIEKKKEKPKPKPKPKPIPPKPKPKPPQKKPFVKGKHVEAPKPPKPAVDFTKFKRVVTQASQEKPLSAQEIRNALNAGARVGTRNQIPATEMGRCVSLVRNALYEAWEQPSESDAGRQPAQLEIRLDVTGRIISYRITQSSGNPLFDQTVLKAAANTDPIRGLSLDFLKQFERLTVEFKLQ